MDLPLCAVMDANACIIYCLRFKIGSSTVSNNFCSPVRCYVDECLKLNIPVGYFCTIKRESDGNLIKAVNDLGKSYGLKPYEKMKLSDIAGENLRKLFNQIAYFQECCSREEIGVTKTFFIKNRKDLYDPLAPARVKDPIPEVNDMRILVSAHHLDYSPTDILSEDLHFTAYSEEISSSYDVRIIDVRKLYEILPQWGWKIS